MTKDQVRGECVEQSVACLFFALGNRYYLSTHSTDVLVGSQQDLQSSHTCRDGNQVEQFGGLIEIDRVWLLACQGRHASPYVTSKWFDVFQRNRFDLLIAGRLRQGFEV